MHHAIMATKKLVKETKEFFLARSYEFYELGFNIIQILQVLQAYCGTPPPPPCTALQRTDANNY